MLLFSLALIVAFLRSWHSHKLNTLNVFFCFVLLLIWKIYTHSELNRHDFSLFFVYSLANNKFRYDFISSFRLVSLESTKFSRDTIDLCYMWECMSITVGALHAKQTIEANENTMKIVKMSRQNKRNGKLNANSFVTKSFCFIQFDTKFMQFAMDVCLCVYSLRQQ